MKELLLIDGKGEGSEIKRKDYRLRRAARAVLFDLENKIALLEVSKRGYWKLPGGGLEEGEDYQEALARECLEETGCRIKIIGEVGIVREYRDKWNMYQISYCYTANVEDNKGEPAFEKEEIAKGFKLHWLTLEQAINSLKNIPNDYEGRFIVRRDRRFLKETAKQRQK